MTGKRPVIVDGDRLVIARPGRHRHTDRRYTDSTTGSKLEVRANRNCEADPGLEHHDFLVLAVTPTKLHKLQKLALILRTWYRSATGALAPNYGV
jgi:hypothetical protein